ncbi:xanthine dehydrogenase family protein molybdopterin-binding subunit [bacterium]|nr:xanthine dehydrogenase family protein molybdopterin-binding subunit [bacterium]
MGKPDKTTSLPAWSATRVVGRPVPRIDARQKVRGDAVYTADVQLPNMAHARFLRSERTHAKIVSIDTAAASAVPGVLAIVKPDEWKDVLLKDNLGRGIPILADEPKYAGEEIVAVCAETEDAAREAAAKIRVVYDDLPHVIDPEEAHQAGQFVGGGWRKTRLGEPAVYQRGDARRALTSGGRSVRIFERTYRTAPMTHCSIEPHAAVASFENGRWTVWESTQGVFAVRESLAEMLGASINDIRVIGTYPGGGFGGKVSAGKYTFGAAYFSKKFARPVRFVQDRNEEFVSPYGRPASVQTLKVGVNTAGKLVAIEQKGIHAIGPYEFGAEWGHAEDLLTEIYECPNVHAESIAALTNVPPPCAMRAPGYAQGAFALEQMMDEIAAALGMDPVEFRLKNIPDRDPDSKRPFASPKGRHGLRECLAAGAKNFNWEKRKRDRKTHEDGSKTGIGVAATIWGGGGGPPAAALLRVHADATADLFTGAADIGTGIRTALAQIAAEELGIAVERIRVTNADTDLTSYTLPSYGSLTLASSGPAVRQAAHDCRTQIISLAAQALQTTEDQIALVDGYAVRAATEEQPEWITPIAKLISQSPAREIVGNGERGPNPKLALKAYGVQFVAVTVDPESGEVRVDELVAVNDSGRVINRMAFDSQLIGGATMGLGMAFLEERSYDPASGKLLNANLADYKLPTIFDQPREFKLDRVEVPYDANSIGAKGLGEPPVIPTAPAVANAVFDAVGARIERLPISRKRLIDSLMKEQAKK